MWDGDVSFDGLASFYAGLDNANKALGGLTYRPHQDWNGNDTILVTADDRGWSSEVRINAVCIFASQRRKTWWLCYHIKRAQFYRGTPITMT